MTVLFDLQSVGVRFDQIDALNGVDLQIAKGHRLALIGANGSGKSTLLRVLHGLLSAKPSQGLGRLSGQVWVHTDVRQAMLFQRPHMLRMSALANVALGVWLGGHSWAAAKVQALAALQRVGLASEARRQARTLSLGQQQRLALARAWAMQPNVLLLDEPTASMDPHAKREVEGLMAEFTDLPDMTLIFASHNLGQVKRLATHVAYVEHGQLLVHLPVAEFFDPIRLQAASNQADLFLKGEFV
ncbi:MAG: phosphate ABC transporter ATP-binding protein [Burkholderiaceae bacterium]|nr:phosphate ABC transporter ATP-binding protein [Burkholderiaceae bacterium]